MLMKGLENKLMGNCDKETRIYCRSFNHMQKYLETLEKDHKALSDWDLSSLGLYLCKCVEQEINSTIVQLIREYLGIVMPDYYCRFDPVFDRYKIAVDTARIGSHHWVFFNESRGYFQKHLLKTVPMGDAYHSLEALLRDDPRAFSEYPVLKNHKFKETWRSIFNLRNSIAHAGTIIECYEYCRTFFLEFMPQLSSIKEDLAPEGWKEQTHGINVEPPISAPPEPKVDGVQAILAQFHKTGKPKASPENYAYWEALKEQAHEAFQRDSDSANDLYSLLGSFESQFDWFEIPFENEGKFGIKDIVGRVVIPAKYDGFLYLQSMVFPSPKSSPVELETKIGLVERYSGKELTEFKYDSMWRMQFHNNYYFRIEGSKAVGAISDQGVELVPCIMDQLEELTVGVIFKSGDKYGYLALDYGFCVPPIYDDISVIDLDIPLVFILNGVEGNVSNTGQFYSKEYLERMEEDDSLEYVEKYDLLMIPEG